MTTALLAVGSETGVADRFSIDCLSVVKVRFLGGRANARHLRGLSALGDHLRRCGSSQSRDGSGDLGAMYSVGTKVAMSGKGLEPYANNSVAVRQLARAVTSLYSPELLYSGKPFCQGMPFQTQLP